MSTSRPRPARTAGGLLMATLTVGCYTYTPVASVASAGLPEGTPAQVELTDLGAATLAGAIGPRGRAIEGVVRQVTDSTVTLSATTVRRRDGSEESWNGEAVAVPRTLIAGVGRRTLSPGRTAGALAAVAVAVALLVRSFGGGSNGGSTGGPLPTPQ